MSGAYDDETLRKMAKWVSDHQTAYIRSGGAEGHIMDMSFLGGYRYEQMLLLRYVGRKSGKTMIAGLGYFQFGSEIGILASKGAADDHPLWYLNLLAGGPIAFQVATQAFNATWREPAGAELEEAWTYAIKSNPLFGVYRKVSKRVIPIMLLNPLEQIPVFRE
jgi:deazaflavin-dependent oxidoreductase (nitroreductase family)